jgi:hypothetical protein
MESIFQSQLVAREISGAMLPPPALRRRLDLEWFLLVPFFAFWFWVVRGASIWFIGFGTLVAGWILIEKIRRLTMEQRIVANPSLTMGRVAAVTTGAKGRLFVTYEFLASDGIPRMKEIQGSRNIHGKVPYVVNNSVEVLYNALNPNDSVLLRELVNFEASIAI